MVSLSSARYADCKDCKLSSFAEFPKALNSLCGKSKETLFCCLCVIDCYLTVMSWIKDSFLNRVFNVSSLAD